MSSPFLPPATSPGAPLLVGFSGGLDSTVLLHWLAAQPAIRQTGLTAVHVHHGLQARADDWAGHCQRICRQWDIALHTCHVQVQRDGRGMEAAARDARRQAFAGLLQPGQWLALAHHQDDQAETFLLRALRGSGTDGLGAMRQHDRLADNVLWRPLLDQPRAQLLAYARAHGLDWIEDPSNTCTDIDRNFLRQQVMPLLQDRFARAGQRLALSARRSGEDADLLRTQDRHTLDGLRLATDGLSVPGLLALQATARARAVRAWLRQQHAPPLPGHLHAVLDAQVLACTPDRAAQLAWAGWQLRRWRDGLYLLPPRPAQPDTGWSAYWDGRQPLALPDGSVWLLDNAPDGFSQPLQVRLRRGGERLVLPGRGHHSALKDCLQQAGIPPWQRPWLPLLWHQEQLLAAGEVVQAAAFAPPLVPPGARLRRQNRAAD